MPLSKEQLWDRFQKQYIECPSIGLALDVSRVNFPEGFFLQMEPPMQKAFAAMAELERGAIANPDEQRMVGHYWLRNSALAPTPDIRQQIDDTVNAVKTFATEVHDGRLMGAGGVFRNLLVVGIGGSALGPQ